MGSKSVVAEMDTLRLRHAAGVDSFTIPLNRGSLVVMNASQTTQVLDRLLDPVTECLTPEVARALVNLRARPEVQARIDELAEKSGEGDLTPVERLEYRQIIDAIDLISVLQAKARVLLTRDTGA